MECPVITMTVKEIAESLGVAPSTVRNIAGRLFPGKIKNGVATHFNADEAQAIKDNLVPRNLTAKSKVESAVTKIEEDQMIANAFLILKRRTDEYKARAEQAELRAEKAEATTALLMHSCRLYTVTEIAKELGLPSAIVLNQKLEEKGIQYKVNGTWVPRAKYSDCGYFEIKQQVHDDTGYVYYDRKVTQEGRNFILNLFRQVAG